MIHTEETTRNQKIAELAAEYAIRILLRANRYQELTHSRDWSKDNLIKRARQLGLFEDHPAVYSPAGGSRDTYATAIVEAELPLQHFTEKLMAYGINPFNLPNFYSVGKATEETIESSYLA